MIKFWLFIVLSQSLLLSSFGFSPRKGRDRGSDNDLLAKIGRLEESDERRCLQLELSYRREHILLRSERVDYCSWKCDFLSLSCDDGDDDYLFFSIDDLVESSEKLIKWANSKDDARPLNVNIDNDTRIDIVYIFRRLVPLIFSLPPLLISRWARNERALLYLTGYFVCFSTLAWYLRFGGITTVYVWYVTGASSVFNVNASGFNNAAVSIVVLAFCLTSIIIRGVLVQMFSVIFIISAYVALLTKSFYDSSGNSLLTVMYILEIGVCYENMVEITHKIGPDTLGFHMLWLLISTVFPQASNSSSYLIWSIQMGASICEKILNMGFDFRGGLFVVIFFQWMGFLSFRAFYGIYLMRSLRFKLDVGCYLEGLYIYTVDVFGGIRAFSRLLTRQEKLNYRRVLYIVVGSTMTYFEYLNAVEVFYFRIFVSFFDMVFLGSDYSRLPKYLGVHISFEHCKGMSMSQLQRTFPQKGSMPWVSVENIAQLCDHVKRITVSLNGKMYRGEGFLTKSSTGKYNLLSVKHMFKQGCMLIFDDVAFNEIEWKPLNTSSDPVVSVPLDMTELDNEHLEAPIVDNITKSELTRVKMLSFLNRDDDGEVYVNFTNDFSYNKNGEGFAVAVNLMKGDSGGPVIAVLDNGNLRYAGAVSKGNSDMNGGNFISWAIQDTWTGAMSSDDETPLMDTGKNKIFNIKRRRVIDDKSFDCIRTSATNQLRRFISNEAEVLRNLQRLPHIPNVEDFVDDESFDRLKWEVATSVSEYERCDAPRQGHDPENDDYQDGIQRKKGKKRIKSKNKDKAAYKRRIIMDDNTYTSAQWKKAYKVLYDLYQKFRTVYNKQESDNLFGLVLCGRIPDVNCGYHFGFDEYTNYYHYDQDDPVLEDANENLWSDT